MANFDLFIICTCHRNDTRVWLRLTDLCVVCDSDTKVYMAFTLGDLSGVLKYCKAENRTHVKNNQRRSIQ